MADREKIIEALKNVYDPEIQLDVWSLGLIYDIGIEGNKVRILMTFTSPMCPYGPALLDDVRRHVSSVDGVGDVDVEIRISKDGSVSIDRFRSGHETLRKMVAQSLKHWKFKPTYSNGKPIEVVKLYRFHFI